MEPPELIEYKSDHDLLIEMRTLVVLMKQQLDKMSSNFVTQAEFWPVKMLVYGFVSIALTSLVGSIIYLVLKR